MTCQEVMEYMQRSLDGDLDAQENELMMNHIRGCPDCADMYERLIRLSSELENLPKVTPSYSLVDAILPRLELLDEMRGEPEAEQSAAESGRPLPDPGISSVRSSRKAKPQRRFINPRTIGGVASAAVVAAIFIALYNTPGFNGLLGRNSATDTADMSQTASSGSGTGAEAKKAEKPLLNELRIAQPGSDEVQTESVETYGNQGSSPGSDAAADGGKSEGAAGAGSPADSGGSKNGAAGDASGSEAIEKDMPTSSYTPGSELNEDNGQPGQPDSGAGGGVTGDQGENSGLAAPEADDRQAESEKPDVMGMAVVPGPIQAESADGRYSAVAVGYTIKIFEKDENGENGEPVFETERKNGKIANLVWSKDGTELTYEVELVQGGQERYVIDMDTMVDTKAPVE